MTVAFISYASPDNAVPDEQPNGTGFVSCLQRQLLFELETELGLGGVVFWLDRTAIEPGDIWNDNIIEALREADILLIVLSRTYATRKWCVLELETFAERLKTAFGSDHRGRILRVDKQTLADDEIPAALRPIQAIRFFEHDRLNREDRPFFWRGVVRDDRFYDALRLLAVAIQRAVKGGPIPAPPTPPAPPPTNGRTVFVAKTAYELRDAYRGVVAELVSRGYHVVPPEDAQLPDEKDRAEKVIAEALEEAEIAVHLIGRRPGNIPDGAEQGIVPMQLVLSGAHAAGKDFSRIIWAPKVLDISSDNNETGHTQIEVDEREPLQRLAGMNAALMPQDQVDGGAFAKFREQLIRTLDTRGRSRSGDIKLPEMPITTRIYLLHHEKDRGFAVEIAKELRARNYTVKLPSIDGEPQEQQMLHRQRLAESDAVLLCWRDGSGTWLEITANELRDYRKLNRDCPFLTRTVLLGGEATAAKTEYLEIYSNEDVDQVLDGTANKLSGALTEFRNILQGAGHG